MLFLLDLLYLRSLYRGPSSLLWISTIVGFPVVFLLLKGNQPLVLFGLLENCLKIVSEYTIILAILIGPPFSSGPYSEVGDWKWLTDPISTSYLGLSWRLSLGSLRVTRKRVMFLQRGHPTPTCLCDDLERAPCTSGEFYVPLGVSHTSRPLDFFRRVCLRPKETHIPSSTMVDPHLVLSSPSSGAP